MKLVTFGEYEPPEDKLTGYGVEMSDIDSEDSGRDEIGGMERERVRADVYKLELTYTGLTDAEVKDIKSAISPEEIAVRFFDGSMVEIRMYCVSKKLDLMSFINEDGCRWAMSFNLIEI